MLPRLGVETGSRVFNTRADSMAIVLESTSHRHRCEAGCAPMAARKAGRRSNARQRQYIRERGDNGE